MIGLFLVDADLVDAVAVPVADDGIVAGVAEVLVQIAVVEHAVVVDVDLPVAVAIDAQLVDAVTVEVAHHGLVAPFAELERDVRLAPLAVAVDVENPLAGVENAD